MVAVGWLTYLPTGNAAPGGGPGTGTAVSATAGGGHAVSAASAAGGHSAHVSAGIAARPAISASSGFHSSVESSRQRRIQPCSEWPWPDNRDGEGPRASAAQVGIARLPVQMPTVRNAWTDPSNSRVSGGVTTASRQGGTTHAGNNLYPGAYGYTRRPARRTVAPRTARMAATLAIIITAITTTITSRTRSTTRICITATVTAASEMVATTAAWPLTPG